MEDFNDFNDFQDNPMDIDPTVINEMDNILDPEPISTDPITPEGGDIDVQDPEENTLGEVGHCGNVCLASSGWEHKRHTCGYSF